MCVGAVLMAIRLSLADRVKQAWVRELLWFVQGIGDCLLRLLAVNETRVGLTVNARRRILQDNTSLG